MERLVRKMVLACAMVGCLSACGSESTLGGSISELFPLQSSRVELLRNDQAFQVSYYANRDVDIDLVLRVTVALDGLNLKPGADIHLEGEYAPGHPRTTVVHLASGEPMRTLPRVNTGTLTIDEGGNIGEQTRGDFSLAFERVDDYGGGRNAHGSFSGNATDATFGDPP
jgi:hypothetical protein